MNVQVNNRKREKREGKRQRNVKTRHQRERDEEKERQVTVDAVTGGLLLWGGVYSFSTVRNHFQHISHALDLIFF